MARTHGRVLASAWRDPDFIALSGGAQRLYMFLCSQANLTYLGTLPLTERRWSKAAADYTPAALADDLHELSQARFIVVDEDNEELLIRSFMRSDKVYRQPNTLKSAIGSAASVASSSIRQTLITEVSRISLDDIEDKKRGPVEAELEGLVEVLLDGIAEPIAEPFREPQLDGSHTTAENPFDMGSSRTCARGSSPSPSISPKTSPSPETLPKATDAGATQDEPPAALALVSELPAVGKPPEPRRDDVEHVCRVMADSVERRTKVRPSVTAKWRDEARLLIDRDKRDVDTIIGVIEFVDRDDFWSGNVMAIPSLRKQFGKLFVQSERVRKAFQPDDDWMNQ